MESSGLAVAAPAPSLPTGITIKDTSNHLPLQQIALPETADVFAIPSQNTAEDGQHHSAMGSAEDPMITSKDLAKSNSLPASNAIMALQSDESRLEEAKLVTAPDRMPNHVNDLNHLDTPARPTHDHGIESNMRDTLDAGATENGSFKVESLPQYPGPDLSVFESISAPGTMPTSQDFSDHAHLAEPSTPTYTQGVYTTSPPVLEEEPSVHQAYAMLKFPDSYYYVKSVNLMITRDERFYKGWREQKKEVRRKLKAQRRAQETLDNYAREPSHHSQYGGDDEDLVGRPDHGLLSTYSDVGGAVSYVDPDSAFDSATALMQRSRRSKNNSSSNHSIAPRSLHEFEYGDELQGDVYHDSEGRALDPQEWAQVAIHPQNAKDIEKISREHLIIRYDGAKRSWVMDVIGNRVLHNGHLRSRGETDIGLSHDDEIIIISVSFRFMLPIDQEADVLDSVEYDEDDDNDDELATSPAVRRMTNMMDLESGEEGESSEEDVPLALQHKPSKGKGKKPKGKEPKPKLVKLKLTNKNASKKTEPAADARQPDDKQEKSQGKAPAKTGGKVASKTGGKMPAKATKLTPKPEEAGEMSVTKEEVVPSKPSGEEQVVLSTEAPPADAAQALPPVQATQASPPAPINLDANSAFAGADPSQLPQKRKGPGRPPKNGLISKRDDAGVKRKMKEYERQGLALPPMNELLELVRAEQRQKDAAAKAASRGEAAPDMSMQNIDPRTQNYNMAYSATTPSQPQQAATMGSGTPNDLPTARSTSPRPRRPAKSPSPMPPQETFSEEQLKKPTITYVFIIDEILQDPALDGQADLQTIYDKIQKRWPYFKYGTTTNGWQSSVRHNLLQCARFVESGKSGKGKYWKINFEHELDPKKRKQVTPPPSTMPRNGSSGPPYQQTYNASYPQGPSGSGNTPATGQPANGQYQQPTYGHQPNGNRPPSQQPAPPQPQAPQPFATIVQAIISYKGQFMEPHKDKATHGQAEEQFNQALNHYSELHAGNTPPTEGKVDETQDPFKTLKQIFIRFGQGDTRGSQNEPFQSAAPSTAAPLAPTAPQAPTTPGPTMVPSANPPSTNASAPAAAPPPMQSAHFVQSTSSAVAVSAPPGTLNGAPTATQAQLHQSGPARAAPGPTQPSQPPPAHGPASVPASKQHQPPATTSIAPQDPGLAQARPVPSSQQRPPIAMPQGTSQPVQAAPQGAAAHFSTSERPPPASGAAHPRPPQPLPRGLSNSKPGFSQQLTRPVPTASTTAAVPGVAQAPQQQNSATKATQSVTPPQPQLPRPPTSVTAGPIESQAQRIAQYPMPKPTAPEQNSPNAGTIPIDLATPPQQASQAPKTVSAGSTQLPNTALLPQIRPPPAAAFTSAPQPATMSPLQLAAELKRPAEMSNEEQDAKRSKIQSTPSLPLPKADTAEAAPDMSPAPTGVKRSVEENGDAPEAKRPKTAQELDSRVPTPTATA